MSAEAIIKQQARSILKSNFPKALIALAIVLLPYAVIDGTTTAISFTVMELVSDDSLAEILVYSIGYPVEIVMAFLYSPVINGYIRAYYRAAYNNTIELKDVFFCFSRGQYGKTLRLNLNLVLRMLLPGILFYAPLIIYEIVAVNIPDNGFYDSVLYHDFYFILSVLSTVGIVLYSLRYFTVFTVSADNPQFTPKQIFAYNKYIMQDKTTNAAKLIFSFTPWLLLCLLVLPMLYVIPYMTQSLCVSRKWMTKASLEVN
ncbi:MAG: DUF975 family protein [Ruminococcus sp.]|uniref:DUF975 family protein n=1 Tax=Ruminococcus sp. TaxID=41978 RepID=UPI0028732F2A|nr:DUF975 family protein [Ruminococcus sp.]MBQ3284141.1 DUF975 family protein [Ruminococcus sp.]